MDETWDDTDTVSFDGVPFTTATTYTASGLDPETTVYARVAAAAGTAEAPVVSSFSTHVTGMTTAVPLAPAPANLEVKARGSDFIEWGWDAVEGVAGYQSQFSTMSTFAEGSTGVAWHGADDTTRRVSRLEPESDGYLRVRTYAGTQAEPTFGAWSAGSMGSTDEPPPAAPLAAPTGLEWDASDDSVTLEWDSVRNAGSYEVRQRVPGGDWGDASCGGGDNVVDDEVCVATGLSSGTDYDFEVRAVPSDTDRYETSDWSDTEETRTLGDAPREPTAPVSGGMGDLNVEWESTATGITFLWDRVADAEYETAVLVTYSDAAEPCEAVTTWDDQGRSTSQEITDTPSPAVARGTVRGLCVRTTDEDDRRLSFAWGVAEPVRPTAGAATVEDGRTTSMPWSTIDVVRDFNYAVRLVADTGRDDGMFSSTAAPTNALQKACADGMLLDDGLADVTLMGLTETVDSGIRHFTGYTLCLRYWNDAGTTDWAVPSSDDTNLTEIYTTPATPLPPKFDRGTNNADGTTRALAWTVPVRNSTDVPRLHGGFEAKVIHYPVSYDHDGDSGNANPTAFRTTPNPTAKTCGDDTAEPSNLDGGTSPWTRVTTLTLGTSLEGVTVATPDGTPIDIPPSTGQNLSVRLCVRATQDSAGNALAEAVRGPWRIGGATTITKQAPPF